MQDINKEQLNELYAKNIQFLTKFNLELANKVHSCEFSQYKLIVSSLEDTNKQNFFNLQDTSTNQVYYNFDTNEFCSSTFENITEEKDFFVTNVVNSVNNSVDVRIKEYVLLEEYLKSLPAQKRQSYPQKIVFMGTLLNKFLEQLVVYQPKCLLVYEENLEVFKYSLFFVDYEKISMQTKLMLSIACNQSEFYDAFKNFQNIYVSYNYSTKFLFCPLENKKYLDGIIRNYLTTNLFELSFDYYLSLHTSTYHNLSAHKVIDFNSTKVDMCANVLLVMSGPSLAKNIDFIKKAKDKFLIVAVGSSLYPLYENNIQADICFNLDSKTRKIEEFIDISRDYLDKTTFICSEITNPKVVDYLNGYICFDKNQRTVGHYALGILCEWGFKNIYTIGNDVCLDENDKEYIRGLKYKEKLEYANSKDSYNYASTIDIKGNFRVKVKAIMKFLSYITTYEKMKSTYYFDKNIYNLSDGAFIEGMKPLKSENINLDDFSNVDKNKIINYKFSLPCETEVFKYDINQNIQTLNILISYVSTLQIGHNFSSLSEYINHRDGTFMNSFSNSAKTLTCASGILRYVVFSDNLCFSALDRVQKEYLPQHLEVINKLYFKGLLEVLNVSLRAMKQAKELQDILRNKANKTISLQYKNDINTYLQDKFNAISNTQDVCSYKVEHSIQKAKHISYEMQDIVKNVLSFSKKQNLPKKDKIVLIVVHRMGFLEHYKNILTMLIKANIKAVHFHILNTYQLEDTISNDLFASYDIDASLSIDEKFIFFNNLYLFMPIVKYKIILELLNTNIKNIICLDDEVLLLRDFEKFDFDDLSFHCSKQISSDKVLFIKNTSKSKKILQDMLNLSLLDFYANCSSVQDSLAIIKNIYNIKSLPAKFCDFKHKENSCIWIKNNTPRYENKYFHTITTKEKSFLPQNTINLSSLDNSLRNLKNKISSNVCNSAYIKNYFGLMQFSLFDANIILHSSFGDDELICYNHNQINSILMFFYNICKNMQGYIIDLNTSNALFAITASLLHKDTFVYCDNLSYSRIITNHKLNKISTQNIYPNVDCVATHMKKMVFDRYNEKISLIISKLNQKLLDVISSLSKIQDTHFDIFVQIDQNSEDLKEKMQNLGYKIEYFTNDLEKINFAYIKKEQL